MRCRDICMPVALSSFHRISTGLRTVHFSLERTVSDILVGHSERAFPPAVVFYKRGFTAINSVRRISILSARDTHIDRAFGMPQHSTRECMHASCTIRSWVEGCGREPASMNVVPQAISPARN